MRETGLFSRLQEVGWHTAVYGIGSISQMVLGYVLIPVYTRYFTVEIYGVFSLLMLCSTVAASVFYLGASSALARSFYDYEDDGNRKVVVSTSFYILVFGALLQISLGAAFRNWISVRLFGNTMYSFHVFLVLVTSALAFISNVFYMVLRFERKSMQVVVISAFNLLFGGALIIYFIKYLRMGLMAPVLGGLVSQTLMFVLLLFLCRGYIGFRLSRREAFLQLRYGIPVVCAGLGYYILAWLDRLLINRYCSLGDVGIYSLGYKLGAFIHNLFVIPFGQIWEPMRMEYRTDGNAKELFKLVLTYYFVVGLLITVFVSVYAKEIVDVLGRRPEYRMAYVVVAPVMLAQLLFGAVNIVASGIMFERKMMYQVYIGWLVVVANYILNRILIPKFGYIAAAYVAFVSYFVLVSLVFLVSNKFFKIPLERRLPGLFVFGIVAITIGNYLTIKDLGLMLFVKACVIIAYSASCYLFIMDYRERNKIRGFLREQMVAAGRALGNL